MGIERWRRGGDAEERKGDTVSGGEKGWRGERYRAAANGRGGEEGHTVNGDGGRWSGMD